MTFSYWVKFDKDPRPERISARTFEEFKDTLDRLVYQRGEMPEWLIRDYR